MILLTNGCSWTYGGGLDHIYSTRQKLDQVTWPKHLSEMLGANGFVNLAQGCGSNQRIFRTTFDYLLHKKHDEEIVAVIQFTEESRFEYYYPLDMNRKYENIGDRWMRAKVDNLTPLAVDNFSDHYALSQNRIKVHNTDIQNIYTYIERCEALTNLFNRYNIKFYFWDIIDFPNHLPEKYRKFILSNYPWLLHETNGFMWKYDRIKGDNHPSVLGHKQIAETMYSLIKKDSE